MSARELSRLARLPSLTHVALVESNPRGSMTAATAIAIAGVLGCSLDWLLIGVGKPPSMRALRRAVARAQARVAQQPKAA